ncbi:Hypp7072 [Branchiostoma lanceolatum]|uniref:Hypp7072 protein n=1 Tax=Branchiostoma lanceolatum TaxID=7740 RepID=A0A8J9YWX1_BRALA|nr:Hypp7072 [Branchiostoma lanceolatum]
MSPLHSSDIYSTFKQANNTTTSHDYKPDTVSMEEKRTKNYLSTVSTDDYSFTFPSTTPPPPPPTLPTVASTKSEASRTSMIFETRTKASHIDSTRTTESPLHTKTFISTITTKRNTLQSSNSPNFTQIPITARIQNNTPLKAKSASPHTERSLAISSNTPAGVTTSDKPTLTRVLPLDTTNAPSQYTTATQAYRQDQKNSSHNLSSTKIPTTTPSPVKPTTASQRTSTDNTTEDETATIVVETETDFLTNTPTVVRPHHNTHFQSKHTTVVTSKASSVKSTTDYRKSGTTTTIINTKETTATQTTTTIRLPDVDGLQTKRGCEVVTFPAPVVTVARRVEEETPVHMYIAVGGAAGGVTLLLAGAIVGWLCRRRTMIKRAHVYTNADFASENIIYEEPIYLWPKDIVNTDDVKWTSEDQVTLWPWEATPIYQRQWLPTPSTISEVDEIS